MGIWGPGLYSDDTACDIRDDYREFVSEGLTGPEATERILEMWREEINDPDTGPVIWLALAETQWKTGRLEEKIKAHALNVIDEGIDLRRWRDDKILLSKRKMVLDRLKTKLLSPQRPPVKIRKRYKHLTQFHIGDAFAYQLNSGRYVIFRVVDHHTDKGGTLSIVELCDWLGVEIPQRWRVQILKRRKPLVPKKAELILLCAVKKNDVPENRIQLVTTGLNVKRERLAATGIFWDQLDQKILEYFGLG